jgi:two-component sensor histidine kinase
MSASTSRRSARTFRPGAGNRVVVEAPPGIRLSTDRAIPLALIIVELVTNALKFAYGQHGGIVWMSLLREQGALVVVVRDHGRGLPPGFAPERSKGLGMRIILALSRQTDAAIAFGRPDKGASVEVRIPLGAARSSPWILRRLGEGHWPLARGLRAMESNALA